MFGTFSLALIIFFVSPWRLSVARKKSSDSFPSQTVEWGLA